MRLNPFRRREQRTDHPTNSLSELYNRRSSPLSTAGVSVDVDSARRLSAVWACIDLIAAQISTLPIHEFRDNSETKERVQLPLGPLFEQPDGELELDKWLYQVLESVLTCGNAYGLILHRDQQGWPDVIKMINPRLIQVWYRGKIGIGPVEFKLEGEPIARFDPKSGFGDLWHFPAFVTAGTPIGLSPIAYHASTIGASLAAQQFGANWFRDGATPSSLLKYKTQAGEILGPDVVQAVKNNWLTTTAGNREPVVMNDRWDYEQISVPAEESQFLDTMKYGKSDIAPIYRIRPEKIGGESGNSMTYSNVESANLAFYTETLQPWIVSLERAMSALRPRGRYVKFNADAFLRTDTITRWKAHDMSIRMGVKSVNEVRQLENLPGIGPEGDRHLWPPQRMQLTQEEMQYGADDTEEDISVDTKIAEEQTDSTAPVDDQLMLAGMNGNGQGAH